MSFPAGVKPFAERQFPNTICMFDVDGTLSPARLSASPEMLETLKKLREKCAVAFVGGSDLKKIAEQLSPNGGNGEYPPPPFPPPWLRTRWAWRPRAGQLPLPFRAPQSL